MSSLKMQLAILSIIGVFARSLLFEDEEEGEDAGTPGSYRGKRDLAPAGSLDYESRYLDTVYDSLASHSRSAKRRLRRYYILNVTALASSAAVPVAVAASVPGWSIAALGALAVATQGSEQLLQDQKIGAESHALAVALSGVLRRFRFEAGSTTAFRQRKVFLDLVDSVEELHRTHGAVLINAVRQDGASALPTVPARSEIVLNE